jgi:hypothetical protein
VRRRVAARLSVAACLLTAVGAVAARGVGLDPRDVERGTQHATAGLREVTSRLAQRGFAGRDNSTPGSVLAQTYLIRRLMRLGEGLAPGLGADAYEQPFENEGEVGVNLLAVIRGRELPDEYVIVGAHYDHLDSRSSETGRCSFTGPPGGEVCMGATDNATGVAAVLAVGNALRNLPVPPRRSVVLALWDAEEDGLLGSLYYVGHPLVPLEDTVAYVNFDILGANLLPSLARTSFAIGAETGGEVLREVVAHAVGAEALGTRQLSYIFGQGRSDYASFAGAGVPIVFFSDATGGCYHTVGDTIEIVDFAKLRAQSRIAYRTVVALAEAEGRPAFVAPSAQLATYDDALALAATLVMGQADVGLFSPADQELIRTAGARLQRIVTDGPAEFDAEDVGVVLSSAVDTLAALERLGCRKF